MKCLIHLIYRKGLTSFVYDCASYNVKPKIVDFKPFLK